VEPLEADHVTEHAGTWFRCLTKKVLKPEEGKTPDGKDYLWYEKGFFTRWSHPGVCRVPCIGTPTELREQLQAVLVASPSLELQDSFAMLRPLLDEVVKSFDDRMWRVTKQVRRIEQVQGFITSSNGHSALVAISAILSWRVWMIILNRVLSKTATFQYSLLVHCFQTIPHLLHMPILSCSSDGLQTISHLLGASDKLLLQHPNQSIE
jgi:hypothetical protein